MLTLIVLCVWSGQATFNTRCTIIFLKFCGTVAAIFSLFSFPANKHEAFQFFVSGHSPVPTLSHTPDHIRENEMQFASAIYICRNKTKLSAAF